MLGSGQTLGPFKAIYDILWGYKGYNRVIWGYINMYVYGFIGVCKGYTGILERKTETTI